MSKRKNQVKNVSQVILTQVEEEKSVKKNLGDLKQTEKLRVVEMSRGYLTLCSSSAVTLFNEINSTGRLWEFLSDLFNRAPEEYSRINSVNKQNENLLDEVSMKNEELKEKNARIQELEKQNADMSNMLLELQERMNEIQSASLVPVNSPNSIVQGTDTSQTVTALSTEVLKLTTMMQTVCQANDAMHRLMIDMREDQKNGKVISNPSIEPEEIIEEAPMIEEAPKKTSPLLGKSGGSAKEQFQALMKNFTPKIVDRTKEH